MLIRRIGKSGNSRIITIPYDIAKILNWNHGDKILIDYQNGKLVIEKKKEEGDFCGQEEKESGGEKRF